MTIEIEILGDRNVIKKEAVKILKYKYFTTEVQRTWSITREVMHV